MKPHTPTILDRWLTAMRTPGLYQQARGRYCSERGFCGLGVLGRETGTISDAVRAAYVGPAGIEFSRVAHDINVNVKLTMMQAMREVGLSSMHAIELFDAVPDWNDDERLTLPQLADRIEAVVAAWKADPKGDIIEVMYFAITGVTGEEARKREAAHVD